VTVALIVAEILELQVDETPHDGNALARAQRAILVARAPLLICLIGAWFSSVARHSPAMFMRYRSPTLDLVRRVTRANDAVAYVTTAVQTVYPEAFHAKRRPGTRFLWTFPLAYLFEGRGLASRDEVYIVPPGREEEEATLLRELGDDIQTRHPKLVFVWRGPSCQACPPGFIIAQYLDRKSFPERGLAGYFRTEPVGYWDVWARADVTELEERVVRPPP
jgi:hypothetical protein